MTTEPIRIGAAYIRVSTDGQLDYSPESQLDEIKKFAKTNGILLDSQYIFVEQDGVSGKKAGNRLSFQNMMATAKMKPKPFDVIIVWKFSRFARNQDESTFYKGTLRKKYGIDVLSVSEHIMEGMYGRLIEMIIEWQDEFYSYNLSGEVHRGMKKRAELGGYNGRPPYGYLKSSNGIPEVYEPQASIVKEIFNLYITGNDKPTICRYLNSKNLKTKFGKPFTSDTVQYILENPFYIGEIRWNVRNASENTIRDSSEWIVRKASHEPLVSPEVYQQAQDKIRNFKVLRQAYSKPVSRTKHFLSGLLKCPICKKSLVFHCLNEGRNNSFQCKGYKNGLHSESQYITERAVSDALIKSLIEISQMQNIKYEVLTSKSDELSEDGILRKELSKIQAREERARQAYLDGIDTLSEYKENKSNLTTYRNKLEAQLEALKPLQKDISLDTLFYTSVKNVLEIMQSECDHLKKGEALRSIIQYIEHFKDTDTYIFHYYVMKP